MKINLFMGVFPAFNDELIFLPAYLAPLPKVWESPGQKKGTKLRLYSSRRPQLFIEIPVWLGINFC